MYETFFQMRHTPFSRNTPVADLYESPAMADTLGRCPIWLMPVADRTSSQTKRLIYEHLVRYIIEHEMLGGDTR